MKTAAHSEKLIVVSNRLPFVLKHNESTGALERKSSAGGLVTAVAPVVIGCDGLWVGWSGLMDGNSDVEIPESSEGDVSPSAAIKSRQIVCVDFESAAQFDTYYNGFCNATLWPLFHSCSDKALYSSDTWQAYAQVNQLFADQTLKALQRSSQGVDGPSMPLVWIHDYHLTLVPSLIRQSLIESSTTARLGFFLHIPFPPWDIFRLLPWDDEILLGMLGCDMVAFHIEDYCLNFIDCCHRRLGCRVDRKTFEVEHGSRIVKVCALPIGIPFDKFQQLAQDAPRLVRDSDLKIILSVDRLDYTKGLAHRLRAFEHFLVAHPEHIEQVIFIQIAVPSRTDVKEYQDLKEEIDQMVGRINGRFSTPNWSPIRYIYGCVPQAELVSFYRDAFIAMVTPLRDGMNLVAKEFVACQIEEPGVLILSPFAGAGETMQEAMIVNPYKIDAVAELIHTCLEMPLDEREVRMKHLRRRERANDVEAWAKSFFKAMGSSLMGVAATAAQPFQAPPGGLLPATMDDYDQYLSRYVGDAEKLALLLDYDGTLAPLAPSPELALLPNETKRILERLSNCPDVLVAVISHRSCDNLRSMVGLDGVTYAGNNGLEVQHPDGSKSIYPLPAQYEDNVRALLPRLQEQVCHHGAWVEQKGLLLTYHYSKAEPSMRDELIHRARELIEGAGLVSVRVRALEALEARPPAQWNKGRAAMYILRTAFGADWTERIRIIYVGDDFTDEDAIKALKGYAATFRVCATSSQAVRTAADRRLSSNDAVTVMLKSVERQMSRRRPRTLSSGPASASTSSADISQLDVPSS